MSRTVLDNRQSRLQTNYLACVTQIVLSIDSRDLHDTHFINNTYVTSSSFCICHVVGALRRRSCQSLAMYPTACLSKFDFNKKTPINYVHNIFTPQLHTVKCIKELHKNCNSMTVTSKLADAFALTCEK